MTRGGLLIAGRESPTTNRPDSLNPLWMETPGALRMLRPDLHLISTEKLRILRGMRGSNAFLEVMI